MTNLGLTASIAAVFKSVASLASAASTGAQALDTTMKAVNNIAKLGENKSQELIDEQQILHAARMKDLENKMTTVYQEEKANWSDEL